MKRIRRTATGPDALPFWIFKDNAHTLAEIPCHMFNLCLEQGIFPEFWKLAKISPLPKVSSPKQPKDLRPDSVTSVMSRVFERLIYQNYLQGPYNRWLTRNQYGFRKHSSTSCMLIRLQHHLWNFRENYDYVRFFSLDISKDTIDTISHKSVIEGVMNIVPVVNPAVVNVIINFLQIRAHYTSLNGLDSTVLYTNQGVPQGLVLGPPLYICSTDAIDVSDVSTTLSTYADDNNPLVAGCNSADNAREVISSLCHQFDARNLFLNVQKFSKEMRIIFNHSGSNTIHIVEGIEVVDDLKVMGLTIVSKLGFSKHIDKAVKQSNSILFSIWRLGKIGYSKDKLAILFVFLFSQSFTMALMFGVVQMLKI